MSQLNQIVAIEKGVKARVYGEVTNLHKQSAKAENFNGFTKVYRKKDEEGEEFPSENRKVQLKAEDVLKQAARLFTEIFDVTATKDVANCSAIADIEVGGVVLFHDAPVPFILFLEKQLNDIHTFVDKLPVLDEAEDWKKDESSGLYKTAAITTNRPKKVQKPIVLYDATPEHPAQTQLISEDVIIGYWDTVKHSGALPLPRKQLILERIVELQKAVKYAREQANSVDAENQNVGREIFEYLFA